METPSQAGAKVQLPLDLDWPRKTALRRSDFVEGACNTMALEMLDFWEEWPDRRLMLCGPTGCGKTHLAAIWASEAGATFVDPARLEADNLRDVAALGQIVLEDVDRALESAGPMRAARETMMLHLLNILLETGATALLTARRPPARWRTDLPDLGSRLRAVTVFRVGNPDSALMSQVLLKLFDDRSMTVGPRAAEYIALRLDRNFEAVGDAVDRLDRRSVETKRPVTVGLAKEVFGW